jgi:hypothetical protein
MIESYAVPVRAACVLVFTPSARDVFAWDLASSPRSFTIFFSQSHGFCSILLLSSGPESSSSVMLRGALFYLTTPPLLLGLLCAHAFNLLLSLSPIWFIFYYVEAYFLNFIASVSIQV